MINFLLPLLLLLSAGIALGAETISPPPGGEDALAFDQARLRKSDAEATGKWIEIDGMPFKKAYRVELPTDAKTPKAVQLNVPVDQAIKKDDVVLLSFWVRRPKSSGEPGPAAIYAQAGVGKPRWEFKFSPYRPWQQHVRAFKAPAEFIPKKGNVSVHLGTTAPVIEVADFHLLNYGPDHDITKLPKSSVSYEGREPDAKWRKEALARIEKIRKAELTVEVVDAQGKPVEGADVKIELQRHAFGFGNAVNAHLLGAKENEFPYTKKRNGVEFTTTWQDAQKYRQVVKDHFNAVTFESALRPHSWKRSKEGKTKGWKRNHEILVDGAFPWLKQNQIDIRGHYLSWGAMNFTEIEKVYLGNPEGHRKWLWQHMADVIPGTENYVKEWDTINHIVAWGNHTYEKEHGGLKIYADIMKEARRLAPDAKHAINEGKILPNGYKREPYKRIIRFLNEQGQAPDSVGFMAHFGLTELTPPEELLNVYDDFAKLAPNLQLSELDVDAGDDEKLQADYYRDVLIASFSHPNLEAIIQWGFWENAHWKPAAALWRKDWTIKPSGAVYVDLVTKQWWTSKTVKTNASGSCKIRGFLGDYKISVTHAGETETKSAVLGRQGIEIGFPLEKE